ncbi:MAG: hypothetical protein H6821_15360 [Planctomycetaceae bacterium]|nr:hypothetical protein [Planctomycetales bacterium]MCB9875549.1 hypothetical protein [Planctomycetaceae bacterium]MCB9938318.1 hypothetical protein [Planctomycetaceae bacterium]
MSKHPKLKLTNSGRLFVVVMLLALGYLGGVVARDSTVQADVRRGAPPQEPFQTGDQRSELVLREILAMLGKMDARLERMEKLATQFSSKSDQQLPMEIRTR